MTKSWTTDEEKAWLDGRKQGFVTAQKLKRTNRFLTEVNEAWFQRFPLRLEVFPSRPLTEPLTPSETALVQGRIAAKKEQLKNWFNWHCRDKYSRKKTEAKEQVMAQHFSVAPVESKPSKRIRQPVEAYQRLFPEETRTAIAQAMGPKPWDPERHMKVRRQITEAMLKAAPQDVKDRVDEWIANDAEAKKEVEKPDPVDDGPRTPEQYSDALDVFPEVVRRTLESWCVATGWTLCLLAGGPSPRHDGRLYMECYHFGQKTPAGSNFSVAYTDFEDKVMGPWSNYVQKGFTIDIRNQRSLKQAMVNRLATVMEEEEPEAVTRISREDPNGEASTPNQEAETSPVTRTPSSAVNTGTTSHPSIASRPLTPGNPGQSLPQEPPAMVPAAMHTSSVFPQHVPPASISTGGATSSMPEGGPLTGNMASWAPMPNTEGWFDGSNGSISSATSMGPTNPYVTATDRALYDDILGMPPVGPVDGWNFSNLGSDAFTGGTGTGTGFNDMDFDFSMYDFPSATFPNQPSHPPNPSVPSGRTVLTEGTVANQTSVPADGETLDDPVETSGTSRSDENSDVTSEGVERQKGKRGRARTEQVEDEGLAPTRTTRTKRRIVAPPRRDQSPVPASVVLAKKKRAGAK